MELRYMGFDQSLNAREYRFDVVRKADATRQCTVTVDLALFRAYHVGIQEGPGLCARKLASDLENGCEGVHELTTDDIRAYATACAEAVARRAESRKVGARRPRPRAVDSQSPWKNPRP